MGKRILEVERTILLPMNTRRVNGAADSPGITSEVKRTINFKKTNYNILNETNTDEVGEQYQHSFRAYIQNPHSQE